MKKNADVIYGRSLKKTILYFQKKKVDLSPKKEKRSQSEFFDKLTVINR